MTFPFADDVTLLARQVTGQDSYGNDVYSETSTVVRGVFVPGSSTEQVQGQDLVTTQPTVYLPDGTDVTAVNVVTVAGQRYDVDGTPRLWRSPFTGWVPAVEVRLLEVTG